MSNKFYITNKSLFSQRILHFYLHVNFLTVLLSTIITQYTCNLIDVRFNCSTFYDTFYSLLHTSFFFLYFVSHFVILAPYAFPYFSIREIVCLYYCLEDVIYILISAVFLTYVIWKNTVFKHLFASTIYVNNIYTAMHGLKYVFKLFAIYLNRIYSRMVNICSFSF